MGEGQILLVASKLDYYQLDAMSTEGVALDVFFDRFCLSSDVAGALGTFLILHYFRNCETKNTSLTFFPALTGYTY